MNLNEFIKRLTAEPRSSDPAMVAASRSTVAHAAAAKAAIAFEEKLESALRVPADERLADEILARCWGDETAKTSHRYWRRWAAAAAVAAVSLGLSLSLNKPVAQAQILQNAFVEHIRFNEPGSLTSTALVDRRNVAAVFAHTGTDLQDALDNVTFASLCLIGGRPSAHVVVTDENGDQTTVMLIPKEQLAERHGFQIDGMTAEMLAVDSGVFGVFGHQGQDITELSKRLGAQTIAIGVVSLASR